MLFIFLYIFLDFLNNLNLTLILKSVEYGNILVMPANGRRDLIQRLTVNAIGSTMTVYCWKIQVTQNARDRTIRCNQELYKLYWSWDIARTTKAARDVMDSTATKNRK